MVDEATTHIVMKYSGREDAWGNSDDVTVDDVVVDDIIVGDIMDDDVMICAMCAYPYHSLVLPNFENNHRHSHKVFALGWCLEQLYKDCCMIHEHMEMIHNNQELKTEKTISFRDNT